MSQHILYEVEDGIATITIDRPEKKNAMTYEMLGDFIEVVRRAGADAEARVVILTGVPGAFCAGTDLADLASIPGEQRGLRGSSEERDRWWPLVECPKPVIAAVDGAAVGMGAEFTSQCDVRLATRNARFAWNFSHRGLVPDTGAGSWLLPRLIGPARALRLLYTGEFLSAERALEFGYLDALVEPDQLQNEARGLAAAMLKGSPFSHARIKALVYEGLGAELTGHMQRHTQAMAECFKSYDHQEGVAAFLERRDAKFTGT
ncbi:MAG: enoyl-CoA hydratase/isomerase family protein [Pseudomonadales bacterium]